jgi:hypothetical protein
VLGTMDDVEIKNRISDAVGAFSKGELTGNAFTLFETLGYNTHRRTPFVRKNFQFFKESFLDVGKPFNEEKARVDHWKEVDLLFQHSLILQTSLMMR